MEILDLKEEIGEKNLPARSVFIFIIFWYLGSSWQTGEKEKDFLAKEKELNWLYETSMAEASGNIKASGGHRYGDEDWFWNIS